MLVAFLVPVGLNKMVPAADTSTVVAIDQVGDADFVLHDDSNKQITCRQSDLAGVFDTYRCANTVVYTGSVPGSDNQDETLKRMIRANTYESAALEQKVANLGENIRVVDMVANYGIMGVSLATSNDGEEGTSFVVIAGKDDTEVRALAYYSVITFRSQDTSAEYTPPALPEEMEQSLSFDAHAREPQAPQAQVIAAAAQNKGAA